MLSSKLPAAEKLHWTSRQWKEYVDAWNSGTNVSENLYNACPGLFKKRDNLYCINKQLDRSHEVLSYATALMWRYAIVQVCERLNVHPVDIAFSHELSTSSHRTPYMGQEENPLVFQILLDRPSYSGEVLKQLDARLSHIMVDILTKRGVESPCLYLQVDDVSDFPKGYSSQWRMGCSPSGLEHGLKSAKSMESNPQLLHAWRSRSPSTFLTSAAAAGSLAHRGELYLRWLDGVERPEAIKPIDEKVVEQSWPSAMKFFHMWAALGIRERNTLREALSKVELRPENTETLELPNDFLSLD